MKLLARLEKNASFWYLTIISVLFFLLRFPSLFEPDWYGDEGVYQTVGLGINAGRLLYRDIFDNKPPLLYVLYALVSSNEFMIRLLSLAAGLFAVWGFFVLSKKLLTNQKAVFVSTAVFAILFGLPLIEGNIANAENFMLLPTILSIIVLLTSLKKPASKKIKLLFISGLIAGISLLFKIVAVFDFAALFIFLSVINLPQKFPHILYKENLKKQLRDLLPLTAGFLTPITITSIYFIWKGAFTNFINAVFFNNISYVGYANNLIFPQGLLILKLIFLALFLFFILLKRRSFTNNFILISLWFALSIFNAFFSERPYTHYLLVFLPSFCLMAGYFILNTKLSKLSGVFILSSFILILLNFKFYTKTLYYYQNFIAFVTKNESVENYRNFFDSNTPRDYEIADYLLLHINSKDNIFVWGNNAEIYDLTNKLPPGKYTVAYHITDYTNGLNNTLEGLKKQNPKFIVIMPNVPDFPFSLVNYGLRVSLKGVDIYERLF